MTTETVHTAVEVGDAEREVSVTFSLSPAEKQTRTYPGCEADAEFICATFDDDGSEASEDLLDTDELGREAFEQRADRESAMAEDAADARREFRRDGY